MQKFEIGLTINMLKRIEDKNTIENFMNQIAHRTNEAIDKVAEENGLSLERTVFAFKNEDTSTDEEDLCDLICTCSDDECDDDCDDECDCECTCEEIEFLEVTTEELNAILLHIPTEELLKVIELRSMPQIELEKHILFDLDLRDGSYLNEVSLLFENSDTYIKTKEEFLEWLKSDGSQSIVFSGKYISGEIIHPSMISHYEYFDSNETI